MGLWGKTSTRMRLGETESDGRAIFVRVALQDAELRRSITKKHHSGKIICYLINQWTSAFVGSECIKTMT